MIALVISTIFLLYLALCPKKWYLDSTKNVKPLGNCPETRNQQEIDPNTLQEISKVLFKTYSFIVNSHFFFFNAIAFIFKLLNCMQRS